MMNINYTIHKDRKTIHIIALAESIIDCQTIHEDIYQSIQTQIKAYEDSIARENKRLERNKRRNEKSDKENEKDGETNEQEQTNPSSHPLKDITLGDLKSYEITLFFYSHHLTGSDEAPDNPLYFGELEENEKSKEKGFKANTPVYYLITPSGTADSSNEEQCHLRVFLGNATLTLYHYSLSDSSLGITLNLKSKESQELKEKERQKKEKQKKQKEIQASLPPLSAFTPVIEDDILMCPHGGQVQLKSNKGKNFKSKGTPLILQSDLLNAPISGCSNPAILGGPCTLVSVIPPPALSLKKFNGEGAPLQEFVPLILTDKGNPLICTPKPNQFKLFQPAIPIDKQSKGESGEIEIKLEKPSLRLHYKECSFQEDNLIVTRYFLNQEEITLDEPLKEISMEVQSLKDIEDEKLKDTLSQEYPNHLLKQSVLQIGVHCIVMIFIIPTKIPKVFKKPLESYEDKDYGVGRFKELLHYQKDERNNELNYHYRIFTSPAKAEKIDLEFAVGLDKFLAPSQCTFKIMTKEVGLFDEILK